MARRTAGKRIVYSVQPDEMAALGDTAEKLRLSKIATLRIAVSLLAEVTDELSHGAKIILKDTDNKEREIHFPQLRPARRTPRK